MRRAIKVSNPRQWHPFSYKEHLETIFSFFKQTDLGKGPDYFSHDRLEQRTCPENEPLNGHAHLLISSRTQHSLVFLVEEEKLKTYDWKSILFVEADGPCPRNNKPGRKVDVLVQGHPHARTF